jgi:hypothetical protein
VCEHIKGTKHEYKEFEIIYDDKVDSIVINLGALENSGDLDDSDESNSVDGDGQQYGIFRLQNSVEEW